MSVRATGVFSEVVGVDDEVVSANGGHGVVTVRVKSTDHEHEIPNEPVRENTNNSGFDQVQQKLGCTVREDG